MSDLIWMLRRRLLLRASREWVLVPAIARSRGEDGCAFAGKVEKHQKRGVQELTGIDFSL